MSALVRSVPYIFMPTHCSLFAPAVARGLGVSPSGGGTAAAWPSANRAIYIPFFNPWWYPIKRLWWYNGGTSGSNADVGIYSSMGGLIVSSGSTARSGINAPQYVSVDYLLPPGTYYHALAFSGTTGMTDTIAGTWSAALTRAIGILQEDSALPLPAQMTPAQSTFTFVPLTGFTLHPSL